MEVCAVKEFSPGESKRPPTLSHDSVQLPVSGTVSDNIYPNIFTGPAAGDTGVAGNASVVLPPKYP